MPITVMLNIALFLFWILLESGKGEVKDGQRDEWQPTFLEEMLPTSPPLGLTSRCIDLPVDLLVAGGPSNLYPEAQAALRLPLTPKWETCLLVSEPCGRLLKDAKEGLQYLFQTKSPYIYPSIGTGAFALDSILQNLVEPGDLVLNLYLGGFWSKRIAKSVQSLGGKVQGIVASPPHTSIPVSKIMAEMERTRPTVVFIVMAESSIGVEQSIEGIGELCLKLGCYLVVDAVSVIGLQPFYFDRWKVDAAFANGQKGIGASHSVAPIVYSVRAVEQIYRRRTSVPYVMADMTWLIEKNYWWMRNDSERWSDDPHIVPTHSYFSLRGALSTIAKEGLVPMWNRHAEVNSYFVSKMAKVLSKYKHLVTSPADRTMAIHLFIPPPPLDPTQVVGYVYKNYGISLSVGYGPIEGKVVRIGFLGHNARMVHVDAVIAALHDATVHFTRYRGL